MVTISVFRRPSKSGMDDTFDFLNIVGSEYVEVDEGRTRCDNCDAFIAEGEGDWDGDCESYYCPDCYRLLDIEED